MIHEDSSDKYSPVETIKTLPRAKTMALDPKTHRLFLSTVENGQFEVLLEARSPIAPDPYLVQSSPRFASAMRSPVLRVVQS